MSRVNTSCATHWENDKHGTKEQNLRLKAEGSGNECSLVVLTWLQKCLHTQSRSVAMCLVVFDGASGKRIAEYACYARSASAYHCEGFFSGSLGCNTSPVFLRYLTFLPFSSLQHNTAQSTSEQP